MTIIEVLLFTIIIALLGMLGIGAYAIFREWRRYSAAYIDYIIQPDRRSQYPSRYPITAYDDRLFGIIHSVEQEYNVELSWAAREMLVVPIKERLQYGPVDWDDVTASIGKIVESMGEDDVRVSGGRYRNAVAVIRAFCRRFCNIPPFCDPTAEDSHRR
jgi:hypothetical protein